MIRPPLKLLMFFACPLATHGAANGTSGENPPQLPAGGVPVLPAVAPRETVPHRSASWEQKAMPEQTAQQSTDIIAAILTMSHVARHGVQGGATGKEALVTEYLEMRKLIREAESR
jgi:hypothetical protein